jgi:hypothetical protein
MKTNILLAILLACLAMVALIQNFRAAPGIDFCQAWGVSKTKQWGGGRLKSPYLEMEKYGAALNAFAKGSNDLRLRQANQINKGPGPVVVDRANFSKVYCRPWRAVDSPYFSSHPDAL